VNHADRWKRVKEIFDAAVAGRAEDRAVLVRDLCGGDGAMQADVESLLAADADHGSVFEQPVDSALRGHLFSAVAGVLVDEAALTPGQRLGTYEIAELIGAGGMGLVYRARDTTLGRDVALKILPDAFLTDADRLARFEREARLLASLNHPNIGSIYGVQEGEPAPGSGRMVKALVLELVEGDTLADRIAANAQTSASRRGLPVAEVVSYASQVIEALEAAHERGIVHRDLKPANIKVTPEGRVKVLDFGLARAMGSTGSGPQIANSPTVTVNGTQSGVLLGTAPYMSPEQSRGRTVDKRTDIWAFGCVLFEMLTGAPAFAGDGVAEVLANVIKTEPDWTALPADTPASLRLCLSRCLQKDPRQRFHDIADVRLAMEGAFEQPTRDSTSNRRISKFYSRLAYAGWAVALMAMAAAVAIVASFAGAPADLPETRLEIVTPSAADPLSFAISPNGRSVVFQAGQDPPRLWFRPLDVHEARPLAGTDGGSLPFWSPDSGSVAFTAGGVLKRIDLASGLVRSLANRAAAGGTWNVDGTIVIGSVIGPLSSVHADSSTVTEATNLLQGQNSHRWPQFLPDGRRFLLFTLGSPEVRGVYLGSTAERGVERLSDRESGYRFMPPAHVLFARQGGLWARRLSSGSTTMDGELVPVARQVLVSPGFFGHVAFSSSSSGSIAYRASAGETQLTWFDRSGRPAGTVGPADDGQMRLYHLSRDGRVVVVTRTIAGSTNVWLLDTERGVPRRLTFDVNDNDAIVSPDGTRVVHQANGPRDGSVVYQRPSDGTGGEIRLLEESVDQWHHPQDWSADGRYIVYGVTSTTGLDLRALPLTGERRPFDVARTPYAESNARFSPDGRWVAYQSTETGQNEIYIQPFPGPGPKVQVSVGGGTLPRWRRDTAELYYLAPDRRLMAVSVAQSGARLETGPPRALFALSTTTAYEPSPDGRKFLVTAVVSHASPISVILNWKPASR
jgi:serine/threonine protein kinase/Tol biopolymer transport system component